MRWSGKQLTCQVEEETGCQCVDKCMNWLSAGGGKSCREGLQGGSLAVLEEMSLRECLKEAACRTQDKIKGFKEKGQPSKAIGTGQT